MALRKTRWLILALLRQVFEKVSRVIRRLRVELEKDVRLELRGADTELDKLIVEELVDPLMHIVRNALDPMPQATVIRPRQVNSTCRTSSETAGSASNGSNHGLSRMMWVYGSPVVDSQSHV